MPWILKYLHRTRSWLSFQKILLTNRPQVEMLRRRRTATLCVASLIVLRCSDDCFLFSSLLCGLTYPSYSTAQWLQQHRVAFRRYLSSFPAADASLALPDKRHLSC